MPTSLLPLGVLLKIKILLTARFWSWVLPVTLQNPINIFRLLASWWRELGERKRNEKKTYVGRGNSPNINKGKGDTLAQKSLESPPPRSYEKKILMGIWRVIGSTRLRGLTALLSQCTSFSLIDVGRVFSAYVVFSFLFFPSTRAAEWKH
eukprot:1150942-Pelagomonas_calceolata.AAC.2